MRNPATLVPLVLGVPDEAGAMFLFSDDMRVIGEPEQCDHVLAVARLCDGERSTSEIVEAAGVAGIPASTTRTILDALLEIGAIGTSVERDPELALALRMIETFVGDDRLVTRLDVYRPCVDEQVQPYFVASGVLRLADGAPYHSHGSAATAPAAVIRAIAEAVERFHTGSVRIDATGTMHEVDGARVFASVTHLQPDYRRVRGLAAFDPSQRHPWVAAQSLVTGDRIFALADTAFFPVTSEQLGRPKVCLALASGTAAHVDRDDAIRRGLLEIIERDAIAVMWASQAPRTRLAASIVPAWVQASIAEWATRGRSFHIIDLTIDTVPVVLVLSTADVYPAISAGCAAALTYEAAIEKAFLEAEGIAITWAAAQEPAPALSPTLTPIEHGKLYAAGGNAHRLAALIDAPLAPPRVLALSWDQVVRHFDAYVIDLHVPGSPDDLWVVRVLSDAALPLTFGFGSEPHGHPRLATLGLQWGDYPAYPHFIA